MNAPATHTALVRNDALLDFAALLDRVKSADQALFPEITQTAVDLFATMQERGYTLGIPAKARKSSKPHFSEYHLTVTRADASCVLSFFIPESYQ